ncbi:hypothetical protein CKM354_000715500 [Cercospora kikuchii]|uniref:Uncharacterized protein n=1 Tax=Cercospora kikuchii TaxID=84275 RepID=A0A9P3CJM0_9PEZI|nr:uncharacterized protein CKM354_000715500 [Cercospora kikuchii]GIZ43946.1 hypothetical protein CKM354_000715500 [Cercospora kikuchii]
MVLAWPRNSSNTYSPLGSTEKGQQPVPSEEPETRGGIASWGRTPSTSRRSRGWEAVQIITCILCIAILLATIGQNFRRPSTLPIKYRKETLTCGNTTHEAKSRGCVFDLLANNWVAPQCLDPFTESEYRSWLFSPERAHGSFPFFYDPEGRHRVPDEHALSLHADGPTEHDRRVYTTREQHLNHCIFVLKRLHRAMRGQVVLNDEHGAYAHTEHCATQLYLDNVSILDKLVEECYIGYANCTIDVPI